MYREMNFLSVVEAVLAAIIIYVLITGLLRVIRRIWLGSKNKFIRDWLRKKLTPLHRKVVGWVGILAAGEFTAKDAGGTTRYFRTTSGTGITGDPWVPTVSVDGAATSANQANLGSVTSATLSNVVSSATSVTLAALNTSRKGLTIYNDSTQILYVKFGATASTTSYTVQIASNGYFEMPLPIYTGAVDGIWASANGNARVTET